jgi:type I restriction enzyme S subunit
MPREGYKITELGELPKEWVIKKIKQITQYVSYGFTNPMPTTNEGPYMVTAADIADGKIIYDKARHTSLIEYKKILTAKSKPEIDDVLITKDGTLGRVAKVDRNNICINQSVACMRLNGNDSINVDFFIILLQSNNVQNRILFDASGSTIKHIYITKLAETPLAIPPLPEQHRIAEILSNVDETIEHTEALIEKYRNIKKGLMADLLTRGIDEEGRIRSEETHRFKDSPFGRIPEEWDIQLLMERANVFGGKRLPFEHAYANTPTGYKYLRTLDFIGHEINFNSLLNLSPATFSVLKPYEIFDGNIYISIAGVNLGFAGVFRPGIRDERTILTENAARIELSDNSIPEFVALQMNGETVQKQIVLEKGIGAGVPKLALFRIKRLILIYPSREEQSAIINIINQFDERLRTEIVYLSKVKAIKIGLMQDLLAGRVRVKVPQEAVA